jgi:hypothetical protein
MPLEIRELVVRGVVAGDRAPAGARGQTDDQDDPADDPEDCCAKAADDGETERLVAAVLERLRSRGER